MHCLADYHATKNGYCARCQSERLKFEAKNPKSTSCCGKNNKLVPLQVERAPDPSEIKSVFTRYHTNYDQKYAQYIFAVAWTVVIIFIGTCVWMRFFQDTNDDFLSMEDFSPQKVAREIQPPLGGGASFPTEQ